MEELGGENITLWVNGKVRQTEGKGEWPTNEHGQMSVREKAQILFILLGIWFDSYNNLILFALETRGKPLLSYLCDSSISPSKK